MSKLEVSTQEGRKVLDRYKQNGTAVVGVWNDIPILLVLSEEGLDSRDKIADHQRLFDLVRHQRHTLLETNLITREEFSEILSGGGSPPNGSVARLESYDEMRQRIATLEQQLEGEKARRIEIARRMHITEGHNQQFGRCESAWCHPGTDAVADDPALEAYRGREIRYEEMVARVGELERELEGSRNAAVIVAEVANALDAAMQDGGKS